VKHIKVKLTGRELQDLIFYINCILVCEGLTPTEKLIDACLTELLHKLLIAQMMVKDAYKIQIKVTHAMALMAAYNEIPSDDVTILRITGVIHQKHFK